MCGCEHGQNNLTLAASVSASIGDKGEIFDTIYELLEKVNVQMKLPAVLRDGASISNILGETHPFQGPRTRLQNIL